MNIERLQRLCGILEKVPPENFEMDCWRGRCGTEACAVGWACLDKDFNKEGLHLDNVATAGNAPVFCPEFGPFNGWDAVTEFFQLTMREALYLFLFGGCGGTDVFKKVDPSDVIERIQEAIGRYVYIEERKTAAEADFPRPDLQ